MRILRSWGVASAPLIAIGLATFGAPEASAGGTSERTCAEIGNGITVQANTGIDNLIVTVALGDVITAAADAGNFGTVDITNGNFGANLATLTAGQQVQILVGDAALTSVSISAFSQNEGNGGDSANVTCVLAADAAPPPEELGAEEPEVVAPSTEDVQNAFSAPMMMSHLGTLYDEVHRNTAGVLNGTGSQSITENGLFLQSAGRAAKDIAGTPPTLNVFVAADVSKFDGDSFDGLTGNLTIGMDYRVSRDIVVGALVSGGRADFSTLIGTNVGSLENTGYTIGLYGAAKVVGAVTVDGMITYSGLNYDVANGGTTGDFDASRFGISVGVYNQMPFMGAILEPHARVIYGIEEQDGYTDSVGRAVGSNSVNAGRVVLGPRLIAPMANGFTPWISANGVYEFSDSGNLATGAPDFDDTFSGTVGAGFDWDSDLGRIGADIEYGGLGSGLYHSISGSVQYTLSF